MSNLQLITVHSQHTGKRKAPAQVRIHNFFLMYCWKKFFCMLKAQWAERFPGSSMFSLPPPLANSLQTELFAQQRKTYTPHTHLLQAPQSHLFQLEAFSFCLWICDSPVYHMTIHRGSCTNGTEGYTAGSKVVVLSWLCQVTAQIPGLLLRKMQAAEPRAQRGKTFLFREASIMDPVSSIPEQKLCYILWNRRMLGQA